jgi:hypothetical protein
MYRRKILSNVMARKIIIGGFTMAGIMMVAVITPDKIATIAAFPLAIASIFLCLHLFASQTQKAGFYAYCNILWLKVR